MQLIPVIDIKNAVAVHAKLGLRDQYQPLNTPLCPCSVVEDVIKAFLNLHPFQIIYLADLNAITNTGDNEALILKLLQNYPDIQFWIDSGYQAKPNNKYIKMHNYQAVLGTECYPAEKLICLEQFGKNFILSLDFSSQNKALGAAELFNHSDFWPEKVIVMTLSRVGSGSGVDLEKLQTFQALGKNHTFVASGGIRDKADLEALKTIGINYALCASALHAGKISATDLQALL